MKELVMKKPKKLQKRPLASTLRAMEKGNEEVFPIEQMNSVRSELTKQQLWYGTKFTTKVGQGVITVTRTA